MAFRGQAADITHANILALKARGATKHEIRHLEDDFIMLSEFSEQVGPVPVKFIPETGNRSKFDASQFSVRIMTSDYQSSGKLAGEDTQVLLSEKSDHACAYVHYFSLNDINARGYVRQYCFSYITATFCKLVENFDLLKKEFCEVTSLLKCGNHRVFQKDLEHHIADLKLTMSELESEGFGNVEGLDNAQLYLGYDFTMEDVPERDPRQVENATKETQETLALLMDEIAREENQRTWEKIKTLKIKKKNQFIMQPISKPSSSPALKRAAAPNSVGPGFNFGSPDSDCMDIPQSSFTADSYSELTNSTSSDQSHYQPQRVMTHTVHKFERRLRPLEDLSPKTYSAAMDKLNSIHRFFNRSEMTLEMEKEEASLLDPRSSLLSISRVPMVNFLQNFHYSQSEQPCHLLHPRPYQISCKNTWGQPSEAFTFHEECSGYLGREVMVEPAPPSGKSGFDTAFMEERSSLNKYPLYIDLSHRSHSYRFSSINSYLDQSFNQTPLTDTLVKVMDSPLDQHPSTESTNEKHSSSLMVQPDDDRFSRGSSAFHTPNSGLTPSSSNEGESEKSVAGWGESGPINRVTQITNFSHREQKQSDNEVAGLKTVTRTPSQQSFSSANGDFHQSELFGGKTRPTITASEITVQPEISQSRSPSPHVTTGGDVFTEESFEDWGPPNSLSHNKHEDTTHRLHRGQIEEEESHSAGSGQFDNNPLHTDPTHFHGSSSIAELKLQEQLRKVVNGHPRVIDLGKQSSASGAVSPERYYSPMGEPSDVFGADSHVNPLSPSRQGLVSQMSSTQSIYRGPSVLEIRGKGRLPLVSSIDLVECECKFKPGRGILQFWKDNPLMKDLIYCLLQGRPLAIIGKPGDEHMIRRLVRLLWMFIPGHSSKQQVVTWQESPLNVKDLSRVKLIGLSNKAASNMGPHIKRYISHWDVTSGKLSTPEYKGDLLKPILSRTRNPKNEQAFMAHTLSVLLEISMKAFVYYHSYKTPRPPGAGDTTAKVYHSVLQRDSPQRQRDLFLKNNMSIKEGDIDILEYLVDIIQEQQLIEWKSELPPGTPQDDEPVTFKLYTKQCRELTHKPKRPY